MAVASGMVSPDGLIVDRHFVVTDSRNRHLCARNYSQMVLIEPEIVEEASTGTKVLLLNAPGMEEIRVALPANGDVVQEEGLKIWSECKGVNLGQEVGEWLSTFLADREDKGLK